MLRNQSGHSSTLALPTRRWPPAAGPCGGRGRWCKQNGEISGGVSGSSTRRGRGAGVQSARVSHACWGRLPAVGDFPRLDEVTVALSRVVLVPEASRSRSGIAAFAVGASSRARSGKKEERASKDN